MSSRFNPVALLTRRRSKSKSKSRSESVTVSIASHTLDNEDSEECSVQPQIVSKPATSEIPESGGDPSPKPRFRLFNSLRRTRSPGRTSRKGAKIRSGSVPPADYEPPTAMEDDRQPPTSSHQPDNNTFESTSIEAPLAQTDCFELTDVSDQENDYPHARRLNTQLSESGTNDALENHQTIGSEERITPTDDTPTCFRMYSIDSDADGSTPHSTTSREGTIEEDDATWSPTSENTPTLMSDETSVRKLIVEYETDYPMCERSDSTLSPTGSLIREEEWTVEEEEEGGDDDPSGPDDIDSPVVSVKLAQDMETVESGIPDSEINMEGSHELDDDDDETVDIVFNVPPLPESYTREKQYIETDEGIDEEEQEEHDGTAEEADEYPAEEVVPPDEAVVVDDQLAPQFDVEQDPTQDPFYAAELATTDQAWTPDFLNSPSIIVTSASTGSIKESMIPEPSDPPQRPPPPVPDGVPKRPPPPPVGPGQGPPSRPPPVSTDGSKKKEKKNKLFGVVDLGPLPSDPDPNFPFRKHLEKSVVPNPKKAIQRIFRGETKAERRKRKEQVELDRLFKGSDKSTSGTKEGKEANSKDWEAFQALSAQIQHTVQETASKVRAKEPPKPHPLEAEESEEEETQQETEGDWAKFDRAFKPEVETPVIGTANPWEETEATDQAETFFRLESEESEVWAEEQQTTETTPPEPVVEKSYLTTQLGGDFFDQSKTELELELEFDDPDHVTKSTIAQDIDAFLGLDTTEVETATAALEPIPSDPLELLKRFNTKPEESPLEDVGFEANFEAHFEANFEANFETMDQTHTEPEEEMATESEKVEIEEADSRQETKPIESVEPVEPAEPVEPVEPAEPAEPVEPVESVEPAEPVELVESVEPAEPVEPDEPVESIEPAEPVEPVEPFGQMEDILDFEVLKADNVVPIESEDIFQGSSELIAPDPGEPDPSDQEDVGTADDVLWGGFGECRARQDVEGDEEKNPFDTDDFEKIVDCTESKPALNEADTTTNQSIAAVRPRMKPVRQGTLSGNNPFRRQSELESDELVKAAAGIELPKTHARGHKKRDSFDSSESEEEVQPSEQPQQVKKISIQLSVETPHPEKNVTPLTEDVVVDKVLTTEPDTETDGKGFDPLRTIYPESDNDSSGADGEAATSEPTLAIKIKQKPEHGGEPVLQPEKLVPILVAPPKASNVPAAQLLPGIGIEDEPEPELSLKETSELAVKHETPHGWIDFNAQPTEPKEDAEAAPDASDVAFEVDWSARPERTEPEPPRPDTPDPELDEPFHPVVNDGQYYRLCLRYPEKKTRVKQVSKYTTDRYWREIAVCFTTERGRKEINLHEIDEESNEVKKEPYRTLRIEPYMQLSREKLQQYDKYGKVHVFKLNHVSYRELVGIRPEKFSIKNLQQLVMHKPKQNIAVDHLPVYTEVLKFGSLDQKIVRKLMPVFEDSLMQIAAHKDTTLSYNREEVCCYVVDEYNAKVSDSGTITDQKARTRILCTAFVNGGPHIVLGLNDKWRYGREVVRRSDILPMMHDDWISIRNAEFHSCVDMEAYEKDHMLKFYPLDGCRFELMRFRVSLRGNRELPMQVRTVYTIDDRRVTMRCELLVPGFFSACGRKGAVPCENVEIHIPVPEDWVYHFRVEKHHKYGSVHSTLRKPGRIKGFERITQMAQSLLPPSILEASIGLAKYEHLYKAVVWRIPRIPDKTEASFRPHLLTCKLLLAPHDTVPEWETLIPDCQIEYTMPSSTVSGATVRSVSVEHTGVAEKFVKYTAKYRYTVDIDYKLGSRKEPTLKSMIDEPYGAPTMEHVAEPEYGEDTTAEIEPIEQFSEPMEDGGGVGDLLGFGMDFSEPVEPQVPVETESSQETPDTTTNLS